MWLYKAKSGRVRDVSRGAQRVPGISSQPPLIASHSAHNTTTALLTRMD